MLNREVVEHGRGMCCQVCYGESPRHVKSDTEYGPGFVCFSCVEAMHQTMDRSFEAEESVEMEATKADGPKEVKC